MLASFSACESLPGICLASTDDVAAVLSLPALRGCQVLPSGALSCRPPRLSRMYSVACAYRSAAVFALGRAPVFASGYRLWSSGWALSPALVLTLVLLVPLALGSSRWPKALATSLPWRPGPVLWLSPIPWPWPCPPCPCYALGLACALTLRFALCLGLTLPCPWPVTL